VIHPTFRTSPSRRRCPAGRRALAAALLAAAGSAAQQAPPFAARAAIDYAPLAFRPEVWKAKGQDTRMSPWVGERVVFLSLASVEIEPGLMRLWVDRLDAGWKVYLDLTGTRPEPFKVWEGRAVIAAVPNHEFTCGAGCGYVGHTGIELAMFYEHDLPRLARRPEVMPHYVFYEMGRNHFTFGDRHSCFTTGFAVFMRYVCMDALGVADEDRRTREVIEGVEERIATSAMPFLRTFTNVAGLDEKAPRVHDAEGRAIQPSDQPVTYAAAMLRLRRLYGGDAWLKRFFAALRRCPDAKADTEQGALRQCLGWYVAASVAAGRDLRCEFVDRWRLPLTAAQRERLGAVVWDDPELDVAGLLRDVLGG
jgi:hypothetical protein